MEERDIENLIADAIMERPYVFRAGGKVFRLYPVTLGKTYIINRIIPELGMKSKNISVDPYMEALRVCQEQGKTVCQLIAYHTMCRKEDLLEKSVIDERADFFYEHLSVEDMTQLLVFLTSGDHFGKFLHHLGIDKERELQRKITKVKKDKGNTFSFGGKSVYGSLIDVACERYGWTMDYVVWGISYLNLRMLLADQITSVYLTDEEKKKARISNDRTFISGDDPKNMERIRAMSWD